MHTKLNHDEKLALTGIIKWVVSVDHNDSLEGIEDFFKENEWGDFKEIYKEMDEKFETIEDLKYFLKKINNKEAHDIILQIAKDIMLSDAYMNKEEKEILNFLNEMWNIELN